MEWAVRIVAWNLSSRVLELLPIHNYWTMVVNGLRTFNKDRNKICFHSWPFTWTIKCYLCQAYPKKRLHFTVLFCRLFSSQSWHKGSHYYANTFNRKECSNKLLTVSQQRNPKLVYRMFSNSAKLRCNNAQQSFVSKLCCCLWAGMYIKYLQIIINIFSCSYKVEVVT